MFDELDVDVVEDEEVAAGLVEEATGVESDDDGVVLPALLDPDVALAVVVPPDVELAPEVELLPEVELVPDVEALLELEPLPEVELLPDVFPLPEFELLPKVDLPEIDEPDPRIEFRMELRLTIAIPQNDFEGHGVC